MEANFLNSNTNNSHGASKFGSKSELELDLSDRLEENGQCGHRIFLSEGEVDAMNFKVLASVGDRQISFFVPREQPIELLFFRRIFTRLREQVVRANEVQGRCSNNMELIDESEENIPVQAFQRAMGRLFYVLRDLDGFDSKVYDQNGNGYVGWGEFCYVWKDRKITIRLSLCERIYLTFDDPQSSVLARIVSVATLSTIMVSSLGFILSTMPELQDKKDDEEPQPLPAFATVENVCLIIFVLEYLVRLCTCWAIREEVFDKATLLELACGYEWIRLSFPVMRVLRFVFNISNLIDLAAILPGVITGIIWLSTRKTSFGGGGFVVLRLIRLTKIFRAFRLGKYVEPVLVITRTVKQSTKALYVLAFNLLLGVVIFGSLMYLMEQGEWNESNHEYMRVVDTVWNETSQKREEVREVSPFTSIPQAFWWALVTSTTVGYGDHYPTTGNGMVVAIICMIWSLVILALPVGVIGGTFTQVWDEFAKNKKIQAEMLRREMVYVARAIQRIEPEKVSRLLLLQVWNDDGQYDCLPASPEDFMGEVKLELDLPPNNEVKGAEMRLRLQPNADIVRKEIHGYLNVRYDWTPAENGQAVKAGGASASKTRQLLHGTLRLEVISASDLINTDWGRHFGRSSPYVLAMCYPQSPAPDSNAALVPYLWRSPTAFHSLDPVWETSHSFRFLWEMAIDTAEYRHKACSTIGATRSGSMNRSASLNGSPSMNRSDSVGEVSRQDSKLEKVDSINGIKDFSLESPVAADNEAVGMLAKLAVSMPKLTSSLLQMQEQVSNLSARVDQLSATMNCGTDSTDGGGRLANELRGVARADNMNGISLQPGHDRDPKTPWERTDLNGGGSIAVSSPLVEDVVDVGIVNGGPNAHSIGLVADSVHLPNTIPQG